MLTTLLLVNFAALAGTLAFARFDSQLVDDTGLPLDRNGEWRERVVPAAVASEAPALV